VKKTGQGSVRIIAGTLRGSKLPVLESEGLRPTSDRVRETVFNWIQHSIQGREVLDMFAGSGALGFEAASRQAAHVTLLENNPEAIALLRENRQRLNIANADVIQADSMSWLQAYQGPPFNLVFLDPPYSSKHWPELWPVLGLNLADKGLVYIELDVQRPLALPEGFLLLKQGKTRQSRFLLAEWQKPPVG
jgi:16S rRNA (guanine966-N2)-methyltransferase